MACCATGPHFTWMALVGPKCRSSTIPATPLPLPLPLLHSSLLSFSLALCIARTISLDIDRTGRLALATETVGGTIAHARAASAWAKTRCHLSLLCERRAGQPVLLLSDVLGEIKVLPTLACFVTLLSSILGVVWISDFLNSFL